MAIRRPFARSDAEAHARGLYENVVAQARRPEFYADLGVPDTLDGRFDMIVLHTHLVLRWLRGQGRAADRLAQALVDLLFADMDQNLREMGVGDLSVGRRVKTMAKAFYGRVRAYEAAFAERADDELREALLRNIYRGVQPPAGSLAALARYVRGETTALAGQALDDLLAGRVRFAAPPAASA